MHSEAWGDPLESRERRGGHRGHGREPGRRGGPFPGGRGGAGWGQLGSGGRGPRVGGGDVRAAILDLLAEGQRWNGYQIIQEIGARTEGVWRPSAGSVYPALAQLEDEALIKTEAGEDRRRKIG